MPFPPQERSFQIKVQGGKCQTLVYTEQRGFQICGRTERLELDHLYPESQLIVQGKIEPNTSPGILRCQMHHTGSGIIYDHGQPIIAPKGDPQWSRHPDMGRARELYRLGNKDAFKDAAQVHVLYAGMGLRITNDDCLSVQEEVVRVQEMNTRYVLATGEKKPEVKPHCKFIRKSWTDIFFGKRSYKEDENG